MFGATFMEHNLTHIGDNSVVKLNKKLLDLPLPHPP